MQWFIYKVSLLCSGLYATCPYYVVVYMQSVLIIYCFICKVGVEAGRLLARVALLLAHTALAYGRAAQQQHGRALIKTLVFDFV